MTTVASPPSRKNRTLVIVGGIVLAWFAAAEVVSQMWYSVHESMLPKNKVPAAGEDVMKRAQRFAKENGGEISEHDIGSTAMEILKCSYGRTLTWWSFGAGMSAVTVLKWDERSVVGGVESMHNPGNCLRAAGWNVGIPVSLGVQNYCGATCEVTKWPVSQNGMQMQAYSVVFRRYSETKAEKASPVFWNNTRLKSVVSGRRDAPVLILLAYLSVDTEEKQGDARFQQIMRALFCDSNK